MPIETIEKCKLLTDENVNISIEEHKDDGVRTYLSFQIDTIHYSSGGCGQTSLSICVTPLQLREFKLRLDELSSDLDLFNLNKK